MSAANRTPRLGPRAWMYPEKEYRRIGEERWVVTWWTLTAAAEKRRDATPEGESWEWEPDRDVCENLRAFRTQEEARAAAPALAAESIFGCAEVQCQRVDWFVEEDGVAEWADVGSAEEVTA